MRNDPKQGRWPYTQQAGETPAMVPNGIARHEGERPDRGHVLIKSDDGGFIMKPNRGWPNGNRSGEG